MLGDLYLSSGLCAYRNGEDRIAALLFVLQGQDLVTDRDLDLVDERPIAAETQLVTFTSSERSDSRLPALHELFRDRLQDADALLTNRNVHDAGLIVDVEVPADQRV